jgi:integrase
MEHPAMPRHKLTDAFLKGNRKPAAGQLDYWDILTPGFGVRVSYGGKKSFVVLTRIDGKLRRITLGSYPMLSLAAARTQAERILKDAVVGIDPKAREAVERRAVQAAKRNTFAATAAEFMADHARHLRTAREMQRKIDKELIPAWGDRPISEIGRSDVKALLRAKARSSPISANRLLALISKIFTWALDEEIVQASPAVRLKPPAEERERERALTPEELRILWRALDRTRYPFGPVYKLLLLTGQRRGEVAGMRWKELDGDGWVLPGARAKAKQGHRIPLSTLALEIIKGAPRIGGLVFMSGRGAGPLQGWSKAKVQLDRRMLRTVKALARMRGEDPAKATMEPWKVHDLRRTAATQMRSLGIDRLVVSKILNHAEGGQTKTYDRYASDPEKAAAMERWANHLRAIVTGQGEDNVVDLGRARAS